MLQKFTVACSILAALSLSAHAQEAPPGLILVTGGKTKIGSTVKTTEALMAKYKAVANTLAGETPQHTVDVADFYLMPNEVTNEQYAAFVKATDYKPPYYWASEEATAKGLADFYEDQKVAREEATEAGKQFERSTFDQAQWWEDNWQGLEWATPGDRLDAPVTYVSFLDANAYCDWAGLRLMTEVEYQRAARGDTDNVYPWGDKWDSQACNSLDYKAVDTGMSVGSFEAGAVNGVFDLCANVWEWTSTKYTKYKNYKPLSVKISRGETVEGLAGFDPVMRIIVGGSYGTPDYGSRIAVRMGAGRHQTTAALGFRCASDMAAGPVPARTVLGAEVELSLLPDDVDFAPENASVIQRWSTEGGTANVSDYSIITRYERTLFCPVEEIPATSSAKMASATSADGPMLLGLVSFEHPLMAPELDGGTYYVAWRGANKLRATDEDEDAAAAAAAAADDFGATKFSDVHGFDAEIDCFFFYDLKFQPIVAWPAGPLEFNRTKDGPSVRLEKFVPPTEKPKKDEPVVIPMDTLRFSMAIATRKNRTSAYGDLVLKLSPGTIDDSWK